jgi:hypothetical protein
MESSECVNKRTKRWKKEEFCQFVSISRSFSLDWKMPLAFIGLQLADGRSCNFSAFIIGGPVLPISGSSIGSDSLENSNQYN